MVEDLKLLFRGGADLSRVLNNSQTLFELFYFIRNGADCADTGNGSCGNHLLRFFLEHGLDPNYEYNDDNDRATSPLYEGDIFPNCIHHCAWTSAALLLEYGASHSGILHFNPRHGKIGTRTFENLHAYLDKSNSADFGGKDQLRRGLADREKRRTETYPAYLKAAIDPACQLASSFDSSPFATIISNYLLQ